DDDADGAPWTLLPSRRKSEKPIPGPFPESVEIVQSNLIFVPKADLSEPMLNRMIRVAAFQNPEFYKAQTMRLPTWNKPRVISCSEEFAQHLALPRGCLQELGELVNEHGIRVCAALPERERSNDAGTFNSRQVARNANASSFHVFL